MMTTKDGIDVNSLTPEQIADMDMDQLSALADANELPEDANEVVTDDSTNPDQGKADDAQDGDKSETKADDKTKAADDEEQPEGVATKNGKGIIPYNVLEATREEAKEARALAKTLQEQKAEVDAKLAELSKKLESQDLESMDGTELFTEEELEALHEDMPDVADRLRGMQAKFQKVATSLQQQQQQAKQAQQQTVADTVQEAIDDVPKLAYLQSSNPRLFKMAIDIDKELREKAKTDESLKGLTFVERFEKVVELLEQDIGAEIKLPSEQNKDKKIEVKKQQINGLDDLPGGSSPVVDEIEAKLDRSPTELYHDLSNMSPEKLEEFMDRASRLIN